MPRCSTLHTTDPKEWFFCTIQSCPKKFRSIGGRTKHVQAKHPNDQLEGTQDMLGAPGRTPHPVTPDNLSGSDGDSDFPPDDFPPDDFEMPTRPSSVSHPSPTISDVAFAVDAAPMDLNDNTFDIRTPESESSPPPFNSSRSPSQSNESAQSTFTEHHPLINGESIKLHYIHFLTYRQRYIGEPCNKDGSPLLDPGSPPAINPREPNDWTPYRDRIAFEAAEFLFKRRKMSQADIDFLC